MSSDSQRERSIDHLLSTSLGDVISAPSTQCLDAETLAAWSEGALSPQAAAAVDEHLSSCARCQAIVATFARSQPAAVVIPFLRRRVVRWAVPAAAVAAGALIVLFVEKPSDVTPVTMNARLEEKASPVATEGVAPFGQSTVAPQSPPPESSKMAERGIAETSRSPALADAAKAEARPEAPATPPLPAPSEQRATFVVQGIPRARPADSATTPSATAPSAPQAQTLPSQASLDAMSANGAMFYLSDGIAAAPQWPVSIVSPDGRARWRVVAPGRIERVPTPAAGGGGRGGAAGRAGLGASAPAASSERSNNAAMDPALVVLNGAAPTPDVAWFVGGKGLVMRTINGGATFDRLTFPDAADLVSVEATDALHATVTTRDGRRFTTSDSGASWQSR